MNQPVERLNGSHSKPTEIAIDLVVTREDHPTRRFPLKRGENMIGRVESNDVIIIDPKISRVHARIEWSDEGFTIADMGSTNGTAINGERLLIDEPASWDPDEIARLGPFSLELVMVDSAEIKVNEPTPQSVVATSNGPDETPEALNQALPITHDVTLLHNETKHIRIMLENDELELTTDEPTTVTLKILNSSNTPYRFKVAVEGIPAIWYTLHRENVTALPHASVDYTFDVKIPEKVKTKKNLHSFTVVLDDVMDPETQLRESGKLLVSADADFEVSMEVQSHRSHAMLHLDIENTGQVSDTYTILMDNMPSLSFQGSHWQSSLKPNSKSTLNFALVPKKRRWVGKPDHYDFGLVVYSARGQRKALSSNHTVHPRIPIWMIVASFMLLLGIIFTILLELNIV